MGGGFTYMTDEKKSEMAVELINNFRKLKARRKDLATRIEAWAPTFAKAGKFFDAAGISHNFDPSALPERSEVVTVWTEYHQVNEECLKAQALLQKMDLEVS